MSWRTVVITDRAKLEYKMGYLVIRGERVNRVHVSEIAVLIIESTAVSITAALMSVLINKKVKVIFCDERRNPQFELIPYYGSHNTSERIRNQVCWKEDAEKNVWTEIVREKIKKQSEVLLINNHERESDMLKQYIRELKINDLSNREGHAAKVYFNALFGNEFTRVIKSPINSALNYGYNVLLSLFNRAVVSAGYMTQIGIFHDNIFNCFNLSSDLMEPFRAIVDIAVCNLKPEKFEKEEKREILKILTCEVKIDEKKQHMLNAVEIYSNSVFNALERNDTSLIKFYEL